mgnify:CR=1 FL=1
MHVLLKGSTTIMICIHSLVGWDAAWSYLGDHLSTKVDSDIAILSQDSSRRICMSSVFYFGLELWVECAPPTSAGFEFNSYEFRRTIERTPSIRKETYVNSLYLCHARKHRFRVDADMRQTHQFVHQCRSYVVPTLTLSHRSQFYHSLGHWSWVLPTQAQRLQTPSHSSHLLFGCSVHVLLSNQLH